MSSGAFDHIQLSAIKLAADRVAGELNANKENDKLIVTRAVFDIAADESVFDSDRLVELARKRLTPNCGWEFPQA